MDQLKELPIPLLLWYRENARVLPWRSAPHALPGVGVARSCSSRPGWRRCWTTTAAFMEALPTVADLAAVPGGRG